MRRNITYLLATVVLLVANIFVPRLCAQDLAPIVSSLDQRGGLAVYVGCKDIELARALSEQGNWVVQLLPTDAAVADELREQLIAAKLWGRNTVELFTGDLPYVDSTVNLLIVEKAELVSPEKALRCLRPGGVAFVRHQSNWRRLERPKSADTDIWTHYLHDAGGNAVAQDTQIGQPRCMRWLADPAWSRYHHTLASISAVVSDGKAVYAIIDEGPSASPDIPGRWSLVARDAYNGTLLWKLPLESWAYWRQRFRSGPVQLPRLLVVDSQKVFCPLGISAPVSAIDARTGKVLAEYPETKAAEEIVVLNGNLLVVCGQPVSEQALIDPLFKQKAPFPNKKRVVCIDTASGKCKWQVPPEEAGDIIPLTLAAGKDRVVFANSSRVVCVNIDSGRIVWQFEATAAPQGAPGSRLGRGRAKRASTGVGRVPGWSVATMVVSDGVVLFNDGKKLRAISAETGKLLWEAVGPIGFRSPGDVFVIDGVVWTGPLFNEGRDLHTGKVVRYSNVLPNLWTAGHHHRCYREKATCRFILTGYRGIELIDLRDEEHYRNNWVRGVCQYGILPCNGMIYAPPHACGCQMEAKLYGFWALASNGLSLTLAQKAEELSPSQRLVKGPAYGSPLSDPAKPSDWPTYRHDALRSGYTANSVAPDLKQKWVVQFDGRVSQPVIADGLVLVSEVDKHRVVALDARTGQERWSFTAGARIDSPPTYYRGLVLFGSADGWVYCLQSSTGQLRWKFLAAPGMLFTVVREQLESVWPVHGSVLVLNGVAYVSAGRNSYLDGGIWLYGLDPETGRVVCRQQFRSTHARGTQDMLPGILERIDQNAVDSKTFKAPDRSDAFSMAGGSRNDILVSDGYDVYMHQVRFSSRLEQRNSYGRHLFSTSRLLDGEENHRSHWFLGTGDFSRLPVAYSWIANRNGVRNNVRIRVPFGLLLCFNDQAVWGIRRGKPYRLFGRPNQPFDPNEPAQPDFVRFDPSKEKHYVWDWVVDLPLRPRAMVVCGDKVVIGGTPSEPLDDDPYAIFDGRCKGLLWIGQASDGKQLQLIELERPPVWDGMAVAGGKLFLSAMNGKLVCLSAN